MANGLRRLCTRGLKACIHVWQLILLVSRGVIEATRPEVVAELTATATALLAVPARAVNSRQHHG